MCRLHFNANPRNPPHASQCNYQQPLFSLVGSFLKRTGLDVDDNGLVTASNDRIEENETLFESFEGAWWSKTEKRKYLTAGNGTATTLEITRKRLTGFSAGRQAETQSTDANGNVTIATVDVDRAGRIVVRGTNRVGIANKQVETLVNGLPVRTLDVNGLLTTTQYDGLMRVAAVIDSRGNSTRTAYYSGSTLKQSVTDAANHTVATFGYDTSGRVVWQADALGHATRSSYTLRGKLHRTWGGGAYPVEYGFDATYGDRVSQSTFRGGTGWDGATWPGSPGTADTTTWTFDAPSGLNTVKTDAMGRDERYSFNIRGQLETREWARLVTIGPSTGQRVKATYTYSGTTGEQTSIAYNDGLTTNLTYTYLRSGLPQTITDRTGTRTLDYHLPSATLISETLDNTYFRGKKDPLQAGIPGNGRPRASHRVQAGHERPSIDGSGGHLRLRKSGSADVGQRRYGECQHVAHAPLLLPRRLEPH